MVKGFTYRGESFEWDDAKAVANETKHGVSFREAVQVLQDPNAWFVDASDNDEDRDGIIGYTEVGKLLFVVAVERDEAVRLISARKVTNRERKIYEAQRN